MKKLWIKKCTQPGARGRSARKTLERAWKTYHMTKWIPIVGWFIMPVVMKMFYPTIEEVEAEMKRKNIV